MNNKGKKNQDAVKEDLTSKTDANVNEDKNLETDNVTDESFDTPDNTSVAVEEARMWQDKYMRLSAEFDNYRKRCLKEKMDLISTGGEDVIKSMLIIIDDMERAIAAVESSNDVQAVKDGVVLIYQKLLSTMRQRGLEEIEAIGNELDTDLHEAVAKFTTEEEKMKGKIIDVIQKGYKLKDKIIRFAKVVVGE